MSTALWWLSFADASLPKGTQFLGAAVVAAKSMPEAIKVAWALGINPGGEVRGHQIVYGEGVKEVPREYRERLLSRSEIDSMMAEITLG